MALLKKLFNKDSQEVKEFWKAFTALYKKANQKNLDAFLVAQKACPQIWQGPFLLSLVYDVKNGLPSDPAKARMYRDQAMSAAKGTEDQDWVELFYTYYDMSAINWQKVDREYMTDEVHAIRKMGVAALLTYENKKPVITAHDEFDDHNFWEKMFWTCYGDDYEYAPFYDAFIWWGFYKGGKATREDMIDTTGSLIKKHNKMIKKHDKLISRIEKGKDTDYDYKEYNDMYAFINGLYRVIDGPFCFDNDESVVRNGGEAYSGIRSLQSAAHMGSAPAVHYLAWLAFSDDADLRNLVEYGIKSDVSAGSWLKFYLRKCASSGDTDANALLGEHYTEN